MENAVPAKESAVVHRDVAAEQAIVRDNDVVADRAVVPEMRAGHEKIIVAEASRGIRGRSAMNRDVLADEVAVADLHRTLRALLETQILRRAANDCAVSNLVRRAQPDCAFNHDMRLHDRVRANFHLRPDQGIRSDLDVLAEAGAGIDDRSRSESSQRPHFFEAEIGEPALRRRADDDMIEKLDLQQFGCLTQAPR